MYKDKLIASLYQYTSKELSEGCILMAGKVKWQVLHKEDSALYEDYQLSLNAVGSAGSRSFHQTEIEEKFEILGHPPQWHNLLLALQQEYKHSDLSYYAGGEHSSNFMNISTVDHELVIDLTTNLQDIPEKDAEILCQLLNLE